jgi:hypothetical protein
MVVFLMKIIFNVSYKNDVTIERVEILCTVNDVCFKKKLISTSFNFINK